MDIASYINAKKDAFKKRNDVNTLRAEKKKLMIDRVAEASAERKKKEVTQLKTDIKTMKRAKGNARRKAFQKNLSGIKKKISGLSIGENKKNDIFGSNSESKFSTSGSSPFSNDTFGVKKDKPMKKQGDTITIKIKR